MNGMNLQVLPKNGMGCGPGISAYGLTSRLLISVARLCMPRLVERIAAAFRPHVAAFRTDNKCTHSSFFIFRLFFFSLLWLATISRRETSLTTFFSARRFLHRFTRARA